MGLCTRARGAFDGPRRSDQCYVGSGRADRRADVGEYRLGHCPPLAPPTITARNFAPSYLEDRYRTVLVSMLKEKSATVPPRAKPPAPSQKNVIDLMAMLKKSLQVEQPASQKGVKPRRAAAEVSRTGDAKRSKRVQE